VYCGIIAIQMLMRFRDQLQFFRTEPWRVYGSPPRLLGIVPFRPVDERVFIGAGILFIAALVAASSNVARKPALTLALICFPIYFPPILPLAYIQRKINLIPPVLIISLFAQDRLLAAAKLLLALVYLSAGAEKLRTAGLRWIDGESLRAYLVEHYLYSGRPQALFIANRAVLCRVLSTLVLVWELSFWLVLVFPATTWVYVAGGLLFHAGTSVAMRIHYWVYFCPVYFVFFAPVLQHYLSVTLTHAWLWGRLG
jgi:hypothetical protein